MALVVDGGGLVNKGGALGTGAACCCNTSKCSGGCAESLFTAPCTVDDSGVPDCCCCPENIYGLGSPPPSLYCIATDGWYARAICDHGAGQELLFVADIQGPFADIQGALDAIGPMVEAGCPPNPNGVNSSDVFSISCCPNVLP